MVRQPIGSADPPEDEGGLQVALEYRDGQLRVCVHLYVDKRRYTAFLSAEDARTVSAHLSAYASELESRVTRPEVGS